MKAAGLLPILMPKIANQRWSCHSCANCCRTLVEHLFDTECERIDRQGWADKLGVAPYVRVGRGRVLNKREDGVCVFLDEDNRCKIHAEYGEESKPLACRVFPFSVRPVEGGWQASLRFDCPSVIASKGQPISQHRLWLTELVRQLDHKVPRRDELPCLQRGIRATVEEVNAVTSRYFRWLRRDELSMAQRLVGAARVATTLGAASFAKVRGPRFTELLDLLFGALPAECQTAPEPPTARQQGMLRQLAFAHAEHVTVAEMRAGLLGRLRRRWQQLQSARRFRRGSGFVPPLPGFAGTVTFDTVEAVGVPSERTPDLEDLLFRYLAARIEGHSVFGQGYYGWPIISGLAALSLSLATAGWLARYAAAVAGRTSTTFEDIARSVGIVDRAATRLPVLGTMAERARLSYLLKDDGVVRLVHGYAVVDDRR